MAGTHPRLTRAWRAWKTRFGLAELAGTACAAAAFAAGRVAGWPLLAAAGLAAVAESAGFYACVGARTARAASRATAGLSGRMRLAAAAWHAVLDQAASCAAAEAADTLLIRPFLVAGAAWMARPYVWAGFALGKLAADIAYYAAEAAVRARLPAPPARLPHDPVAQAGQSPAS